MRTRARHAPRNEYVDPDAATIRARGEGTPQGDRRMFETIETGRSPGGFAALDDQDLFRVHFENLPRPAYIWRREGSDFQLVAYNRAAGDVPYSDVASLLGKTASDLQAAAAHDLFADLEHCA